MSPLWERGAVVAGYDGSDEARQATLWAVREAVSRQRSLVIVNAVGFPPLPEPVAMPAGLSVSLDAEQETVRERAEARLAEMAQECQRVWPDLVIAVHLARVAQDAELLVIGSAGITGLPRMLLGSTAAELLHDYRRPVVVVRHAKDPAQVDGGRVVVGVDGSRVSAQAIGFAFDFADRHGCELVAVHAWSDLPIDALAPVRTWDYDWRDVREKGERLLAESLAGHQEQHPDVTVRRIVAVDRPAHALLEHAEGATLLVVGSHGRGALRRALLGSVSHAMALARTVRGARGLLIGGGIIYLALWIYGLVIDKAGAANFVPLNTPDDWLHFGLGIGMVVLGLVMRSRVRRATPADTV